MSGPYRHIFRGLLQGLDGRWLEPQDILTSKGTGGDLAGQSTEGEKQGPKAQGKELIHYLLCSVECIVVQIDSRFQEHVLQSVA